MRMLSSWTKIKISRFLSRVCRTFVEVSATTVVKLSCLLFNLGIMNGVFLGIDPWISLNSPGARSRGRSGTHQSL
jgi:hypothetical protein